MACSTNLVFDPLGIVTGGISGIGIIIKFLVNRSLGVVIPLWLTNLVLNIPLFVTAFIRKGGHYIGKTLFATLAYTAWLYVVPSHLVTDDIVIATIFGGVLAGSGIGCVFATMATTGGTDLFCALIHDVKRYLSVPQLLAIVDGSIVLAGAVVFGIDKALYAAVEVYICSKISDTILQGLKFAKMVQIISDKADEIAQEILEKIDRGVTGVKATGMYSGLDRKMLYCAVSKKEVVEVVDIIHKIDPRAFVIVSDVREVMGEGFAEYHKS